MHAAAMEWVAAHAPTGHRVVLDVGGRDINGNPQDVFDPTCGWEVVDLLDGPGVTVVGDFLDYGSVEPFDVALHLEVAEHTPDWPEHIAHAANLLTADGVFIFTAAGPGRPPHSALDGGPLQPGEHYENIDPEALAQVLDRSFFSYTVDVSGDDVRAVAWR
jgi:SAM-dependent methyltransferase